MTCNILFVCLALPKHDPELEGVKASYEDGEYVKVNCTASPSNPAPDVDWYINGAKVRLDRNTRYYRNIFCKMYNIKSRVLSNLNLKMVTQFNLYFLMYTFKDGKIIFDNWCLYIGFFF